jgi:hypothetical protein
MQTNPGNHSCTFLCATPSLAEQAIQALLQDGIAAHRISRLGKVYHHDAQVSGAHSSRKKMIAWGSNGAFLGCIVGILTAPPPYLLPPLDGIALAGPMVTVLVSALQGAVVLAVLFALGAALRLAGAAERERARGGSASKKYQYVLMVQGTVEEISRAKRKLATELSLTESLHAIAPRWRGVGSNLPQP